MVGWRFERVVSASLIDELHRARSYPRPRLRITDEEATAFIDLLGRTATSADDPATTPGRSRDPGNRDAAIPVRASVPDTLATWIAWHSSTTRRCSNTTPVHTRNEAPA
jgi:hypothetical protein